MTKKAEDAKQAKEELAYWEAIFRPLGYRIHGWTYRNTASVISPSGRYVSVDASILELIERARSTPLSMGKSTT